MSLVSNTHDYILKEKVSKILILIDNVLDDIQNISKQLRPQNLDALGLIKCVQFYIEDFEKYSNISCQIDINDDLLIENNINREISIVAYRILQEAFLNIMRHSKSTSIIVNVSKTKDILKISIADNGCGMDSTVYRKMSSLGILGMYERANLVGGKLIIRSKRDIGTKVIMLLPLSGNVVAAEKEDDGDD